MLVYYECAHAMCHIANFQWWGLNSGVLLSICSRHVETHQPACLQGVPNALLSSRELG